MTDDAAHAYDSWGRASERFEDGSLCIGIDLGTTNSCVGMWLVDRNHVKIFKNHEDRGRTTPSVVHYTPEGEHTIVGHAALVKETEPVGNTIRCVKRLMGQRYDSQAAQIAKDFGSARLMATKQGNAAVSIARSQSGGKVSSVVVQPEEVSACMLRDLKATAETYFDGKRLHNVVLTVPAYFSETQRRATILSAEMAGFRGIRLLNEPTAAAMAYGLFVAGAKHVVVFDFGGGTLDVSLMHIEDGRFEVLGIGGDTHLGGEDINYVLVQHVRETLATRHNTPEHMLTPRDLVRIHQQVEAAKLALSSQDTTEMTLTLENHSADVTISLTRGEFETLCDPIWKRCLRIVGNVLVEAGVNTLDVDEVIMVGGSTRIPILRAQVSRFFDDKELCLSVNADEVVCEGAAIQAAILSGMDERVFRDVLMMDVIPLPIGIEMANGKMEVLIPKNSRIPVSVTKYFQTYEDDQRGLTVDVYEGDHDIAKDNDHICVFNFALPRKKVGKAGTMEHPVTLTMNASGVLQVQAGIHHDSEDAPMSMTAIVVMGVYIAALFVLYVFFRIYFTEERDITLSGP